MLQETVRSSSPDEMTKEQTFSSCQAGTHTTGQLYKHGLDMAPVCSQREPKACLLQCEAGKEYF